MDVKILNEGLTNMATTTDSYRISGLEDSLKICLNRTSYNLLEYNTAGRRAERPKAQRKD
jgi:uncharacterized membrane protein